ncbi:reverse transcriptase domain-containing protein [Tanacetum coccineum]
MPNNVKTYDGIRDPEDHLKVFQASTQVECWAMPTWCHMFNFTLIRAARVWFDELPPESIDSYKDLKASFLAYFMQQKKHVKDLVEIYNINKRDGETIGEFMERFKVENGHSRGDDDYDHDLYTWRNRYRIKKESSHPLEALKKKIEELVKAGKLSHIIKEIRQDRDKQNNGKKDALVKEKVTTIYMIQLWHRVTRQKVTLSFAYVNEITFPLLSANKGTEGPLVIEAEIEGHAIHRMYVDGGSSMEVLYEHCFNQIRPEIKSQMVLATTSLTGFNGETIWPLGSPSPYTGIIGRPGIREI